MEHSAQARTVFGMTVLAGAMLASGCFHAGSSVKQSMTSGAPVTTQVTAPASAVKPEVATGVTIGSLRTGAVKPPEQLFDLHKPEVASIVTDFQTSKRNFFGQALWRSGSYVPTMADILVREGLPAELAYLPLIESGYQPRAVSPAGAAGPWQFIPETGRRYGLRIDSLVDERRDPIKSTHAAVQYLKDLHEMFGDWELSLAAYNSGEYRVARILAQTDAGDFWDMRDRGYLPSETREYVPRFLAAVRIASAPETYGFETPVHEPLLFELVNVDRQVSLNTAAGLCGVSPTELADLNPELRRGITPSGYSLRVPTGAAAPLRTALANYVEPARSVARAARNTRRGKQIAHTTRRSPRSTQVARSGRSGGRAVSGAPQPTRVAKHKSRPAKRDAQLGKSKSGTSSRVAKPKSGTSSRVAKPKSGTSSRVAKSKSGTSSRVAKPKSGTSSRVAKPKSGTSSRVAKSKPSTSSRVGKPKPRVSTVKSATRLADAKPLPRKIK